MFIVRCMSAFALKRALFTLSLYKVRFEARSDGEDRSTTILVVDEERRNGDLRMAEMAFQMEFHQARMMACPECYDKGEEVCGHLVFDASIDYDY